MHDILPTGQCLPSLSRLERTNYYVFPDASTNPNPTVSDQPLTIWYDSTSSSLKRGAVSIGPHNPLNYVQLASVTSNPGPMPANTLWSGSITGQGTTLRFADRPIAEPDIVDDILSGVVSTSYSTLGIGTIPISGSESCSLRYSGGHITLGFGFQWLYSSFTTRQTDSALHSQARPSSAALL